MKTAVDTSVVLDVLVADPSHGPASKDALRSAYEAGPVVACDVVWAEVRAHFDDDVAFSEAMRLLGITYEPTSAEAAASAGGLWRATRKVGAPRMRVVADYLIGAHARHQADALLTRDDRFYRSSFRGLRVVHPRATS